MTVFHGAPKITLFNFFLQYSLKTSYTGIVNWGTVLGQSCWHLYWFRDVSVAIQCSQWPPKILCFWFPAKNGALLKSCCSLICLSVSLWTWLNTRFCRCTMARIRVHTRQKFEQHMRQQYFFVLHKGVCLRSDLLYFLLIVTVKGSIMIIQILTNNTNYYVMLQSGIIKWHKTFVVISWQDYFCSGEKEKA